MTQKVWKRCISGLLSLVMLMTMIVVPSFAAENTSITIKDDTITTDTVSITMDITEKPDLGILRVIQMDAGEQYNNDKLNNYQSLAFAVLTTLQNGENTLKISKPTAGTQIMAVMRDSSGSALMDYCSAPIAVTATQTTSAVSIKNTAVTSDTDTVTVSFSSKPSTGVF